MSKSGTKQMLTWTMQEKMTKQPSAAQQYSMKAVQPASYSYLQARQDRQGLYGTGRVCLWASAIAPAYHVLPD